MTIPINKTPLGDILQRYIDSTRADMRPEHNAMIDTIVLLELAKRTHTQDLRLEMKLTAEKYRKTVPFLASTLKCVADLIDAPAGVITFPKTPRTQDHNDAPKRH
jgi:hypothetical protein